jgi:radical SAM protein with 4Fe4S-binding SPASM domain
MTSNQFTTQLLTYTIKEKEQQFIKRIEYRESIKKHPKLKQLFIEMTLNCNEYCRHCGSKCGDKSLDKPLSDKEIYCQLLSLKKQLLKENIKSLPFLNITGGEPLLRKNMPELMGAINKLGYNWGITSNGILIDKEMALRLKRANMYSVSISLDGTRETHEWFRRTPNIYDRTLESIKTLVDTKFGNVMVTTVVHKRNINELEELYGVIKELGCDTWRIINLEPIGRAIDNQEIALSDDDYKKIIYFIKEKRHLESTNYSSENKGDSGKYLDITYGCNHYLGLDNELEVRPWTFMCMAGISVAGIQYNGDVSGCLSIEHSEETRQGNIRERDFYDIWKSEFKMFRNNTKSECNKCSTCTEKSCCDGGGWHTYDIKNNTPRLCMYEILHS